MPPVAVAIRQPLAPMSDRQIHLVAFSAVALR